MRRVHQMMVDAALTGDGLDRMAAFAADEIGRPVAIVLPVLEVSLVWPEGNDAGRHARTGNTQARVSGRRASIPNRSTSSFRSPSRDRLVGVVGMLEAGGDAQQEADAGEFLHLAAMAAATAFALEHARERDRVAPPGRRVRASCRRRRHDREAPLAASAAR